MNSTPAKRLWPIAAPACVQQKLRISCGRRASGRSTTLPAGFSPGQIVLTPACRNTEHPLRKAARLSCAICEKHKEKRFCPAVHGRICPQCCGEQREVTLDCPTDCSYLLQAREHEKSRTADQVDASALFLQVELSDQFMYEKEHLLMGLTFALAKAAHSDRTLHDRDLIAALSMLATTYERRVNSGLHYEPPLTSGQQRRAVVEVESMVKEYREAE